jgi:hypothetical protein
MWRDVFFTVLLLGVVACSAERDMVEVTRLVEVPVEVTRLVEVTPAAVQDGASEPSAACAEYFDNVLGLLDRWGDAVDLASVTPRPSLSGPVAELQLLKREASDLLVPPCEQRYDLQNRLEGVLDTGVEMFLEFMAGDDERRMDAYDLARAEYIMAQDLMADAAAAMSEGAETVPRRVHYYAFGETGFSMEYLDQAGDRVNVETDSSFGRIGYPDMPALATAVIPVGQPALVRLYNPTDRNRELTCVILVDGVEAVVNSGVAPVTCELSP